MRESTAMEIVSAAHTNGCDAEVRQDYGGHGPSGRVTWAVCIPSTGDMLAAVARAANGFEDGHIALDLFVRELSTLRHDSMGHNLIYY